MATANAVNVTTSAVANQVLLSNTSTFAVWSTATYPATTTVNRILYSSATNTISEIATANSGLLRTDSSGVPGIGNTLTGDFTLSSTGAGVVRTFTVQNTDNTNTGSGALIKAVSGGASAGDAVFQASTTTTVWSMGVDNSVTSPHADPFVIAQGTALGTNNALSIDTSGYVILPLQPCVVAYPSANLSNVTGDNTNYTIIFNSTVVDRASNFNTGTGTFTAPITGLYRFSLVLEIFGMTSAHTQSAITFATTARNYDGGRCSPYAIRDISGTCTLYINGIADMAAGDTAVCKIVVNSGTKVVSVGGGAGLVTCLAIDLIA